MEQIGIFAKYWQPGVVKTRLAESLGAETAARLYQLFLAVLLKRLGGLAPRCLLAFWPPERQAEFTTLAGPQWHCVPQSEGDLGRRIEHYFATAFAEGMERVVLLGSDSPTIPEEYVHQALALLRQWPVVLGPTSDGGYYLVGATGQAPPIFERIDWSTPSVWEQTQTRLCEADLKAAVLPRWYDVDDRQDLERLFLELKQLDAHDLSRATLWSPVHAALGDAQGTLL